MAISIEQMNGLDKERFVVLLGTIFEHSPWIAEAAWPLRPFASAEELHAVMMNIVRESRTETIVDLFRSHPDLGTRLAVAEYSAKEQQGAGLHRLTPEEYGRFDELNRTYVERFGFPFILAVRGKTKEDILASMEERLRHTASEEAETALSEIAKITGFRLKDLITE
ncbi:2-oxo-4-hydroxy-4-carboxy-5-ureidoimidazoline decarboxylase [Paenibacillus arenilitoris]|uniref:2-oxo-4-hydroxy-4-carboxy-5-ureidoimidazoline decarboxylase n=1 Tax=Paenibacillus arenilitoris TaxID=2772299 RepID=A0A927H726_9BACL|nr:2-oxo-4-hydroxy-4-carboxy-5-ureidoimidazoline decarboxylase [Paenibacillus arenilitoris]MBD2871156.1 2-oxo-4-hydroxy-4-carboxy-5-ureidoimidazoline decarboxylase [Paenibacillus arenilitoris]